MKDLRPCLFVLLVMQAAPCTTEMAMGAEQAMTAKQFEAEFRHKIHSGQTREVVEHQLRDLSVSFELVERKDFWRNSATSNPAAPKAAASALIGTTRTLEHSFMSDTVAQVTVYLDKNGRVLIAKYQTLTAGP